MQEISAKDAQARLAQGAVLLDVREDMELQIAAVKGALHIPMGLVPARLAEIPADKDVICMCHHGMRSANVAGFLQSKGYTKVVNLSGGIAAWASEVDSSIPQY